MVAGQGDGPIHFFFSFSRPQTIYLDTPSRPLNEHHETRGFDNEGKCAADQGHPTVQTAPPPPSSGAKLPCNKGIRLAF